VQPDLFALYAQTLDDLQAEPFNSAALRQFELGLLRALGLAPDFQFAVDGQPIRADARYGLNPEQGFFLLTQASMATRLEVSGQTLLELASATLSQRAVERESKHLMRSLIHHALNGKELKSRELFRQLRPLSNTSVVEHK
jgi:DNA repair protein RecO (recombination protein O)